MNGKLASFMVMVLSAIMLAACASTGQAPRSLEGKYVGAGTGTCLFAVCGFGDYNVPQAPVGPTGGWGSGAWSLSNNNHSVVMELKPDGTGTVSEDMYNVVLNNTTRTIPWPSTGEMKTTYQITYTVESDGTFTLKDVPGAFKSEVVSGAMKGLSFVLKGFSNVGHVSPDGNVVTMFDTGTPHTFMPPMYTCPAPIEPKPEAAWVCNEEFTLFKQR